jgi:hypothetical protein
MESPENDGAVFRPSHKPWKSIKPIPTFPPPQLRRDHPKTSRLRDTHSEGKVSRDDKFVLGKLRFFQWMHGFT